MGRLRSFDDDAWWIGRWTRSGPTDTPPPRPAQLAAATEVGKGSLYNAFNSKRELFDRARSVPTTSTS